MTTSSVAERKEKRPMRSLSAIVGLIKSLIKKAREAADSAALPYHAEIGALLAEARDFHFKTYAEFLSWVRRQFDFSETHTKRLLSYGRTMRTKDPDGSYTLQDHRRYMGENTDRITPQAWHQPIKNIIGRVDVETLNLQKAELKRVEEREAERKLALQLIDIGYKALATKLHPDKGGSRDAMARLNHVRDRLKAHA